MEVRVLIPKQLSLIITNPRPRREKKSIPKKIQRKRAEHNESTSDSISTDNCETSESEFDSNEDSKRKLDTSSKRSQQILLHSVQSNKQGIISEKQASNSTPSAGLEDCVKVLTSIFIEKGTTFNPNDGQIQVLHLAGIQGLAENDIRFLFGCFDKTIEDPESGAGLKKVHVCNWIRFLEPRLNKNDERVNLLGKFTQEKKPVFEFLQNLSPGTEIVTYFDLDSIHQQPIPGLKSLGESIGERRRAFTIKEEPDEHEDACIVSEAPLDLSKSLKLFKSAQKVSEEDSDSSDKPASPPRISASSRHSIKSHPFSISNVLQPIKLFQPHLYSPVSSTNTLSSPTDTNSTSTLNSPNSYHSTQHVPQGQGTKGLSTQAHHIQLLGHHHHGLSTGTATAILRPILRTRGRERSLLPCEVCGKAFDRPSLLKRHMRTHTGEKPHICDVCSKGFSTSSSLNTHRRIHSGEKPHACPICNKRFTASSNLYYHRMTHNKEKPHKCMQCFKSFPTPGDLKSHQYVHSGSWPYNCPICKRGFSKQTNLRNHLLLHSGTGDKPHTCSTCGKKFALACNLRAHLRTHEEDPISTCVSCKRTFLTSLNMLVNGQCRPCILHGKSPISSSSTGTGPSSSSIDSGTSGLTPAQHHHHHLLHNLNSIQTPGMLHPPQPMLHGFHIPGLHGNPPGTSNALMLAEGNSPFSRPNPFLEQLFEWNWRFAKETAGNLGLMQQKLIESQMLAAQLMSVSSSGSSNISDLLRFRHNISPNEAGDAPGLNLNSNFGQ